MTQSFEIIVIEDCIILVFVRVYNRDKATASKDRHLVCVVLD